MADKALPPASDGIAPTAQYSAPTRFPMLLLLTSRGVDFNKPLPLTPADKDAVMIPGDTHEIRLKGQAQCDVLRYAMDECNSCMCQLLLRDDEEAMFNHGRKVALWMPVVQVIEARGTT